MGRHNHGKLWWDDQAYWTLGVGACTTWGEEKLWQWAERVGALKAAARLGCFPATVYRAIKRCKERERKQVDIPALCETLEPLHSTLALEPEPTPEPEPVPRPTVISQDAIEQCRAMNAVPISLIETMNEQFGVVKFTWEQAKDGSYFLRVSNAGAAS